VMRVPFRSCGIGGKDREEKRKRSSEGLSVRSAKGQGERRRLRRADEPFHILANGCEATWFRLPSATEPRLLAAKKSANDTAGIIS
jgi:hypothetical protein